ncbi:MAG: insulinase family protein [Acidobacteria bacterium]|nr:insulinase family protein [Acidobacteriota bacterium]
MSSDKPNAMPTTAHIHFDVERLELPNGLVLLLSENHHTPAVSINAITLTGSRFENDEQAGLASLVGELMDEGTTTRTWKQLAGAVEAVGARFRTFGDYQVSGAQGAFLAHDLSLGLDITADVLMNATFPEDQIQLHKGRRAAQIKSRLDVPRIQASDAFNELIFAGHPQHRPAIGYEATLANLQRQDFADFYRRYFVPNNTLLAIVGDFATAEVKRWVEEIFGRWERQDNFQPPLIPPVKRQTEALEKFINAPKEQVNIFIGHLGIERKNPDYYALLVMDTILGSSPGFTSRIPRILRDEQGLAYSTYSNITASAGLDAGRFIAYIGTSPDNLEQALSGLRREIARMAQEPVTAHEVESAQAYLTGNFVFDFQTNAQIAEFLIEAEVYELGFDYLQTYPERIRAVTIAEVARVAAHYLAPDALTTVVVGPVDELGNVISQT